MWIQWRMENVLKDIENGALPQAVEGFFSLTHEQQEGLLTQLVKLRSDNTAKFLTLLYDRVTDKKIQKLIKKGLFHLKTQGIRVEEPKAAGEPVLKKAETTREARAYLSNYDPEETRVVIVALETKRNQFIFTQGIMHFSKGLQELASFPIPRNELEELLKDSLGRIKPPMVMHPISVPYAGYLMEEAAGLSGKNTEEARVLKRLAAEAKGDVRRPHDIYGLHTDEGLYPESLERILAHSIFEPFRLRWSGIEEDQKRLDEAINPSIVLPPYVVQERREAFLTKLIENDRIRSQAPLLKRMLEDYAYLFYCLGELRYYRGLVEQMKDDGAVPKVLLHFAMKSLEAQKKEEEPGVIVDPFAEKTK